MNHQVLVLGNSQDAHAFHIYECLKDKGIKVNYFDTHLFPTQIQLSFDVNHHQGYLSLAEDCEINWQAVKSIYWRSFNAIHLPNLQDQYQQHLAYRDTMSTLNCMLKAWPTRWVNSWDAYEFHKHKPLQLSKVNSLGVKIPRTLITNSYHQVLDFYQSIYKVIFKPVYGGATTKPLTEEFLEPQRLKLVLKISPITLQECIAGTNIRSFVIGDQVYSAEIRSAELDFREDLEHELIPLETPEVIQQQCLAIKEALLLEWTAIDWRLTPSGDYIFLEANPSPMFLYFESETGLPITQNLIDLLLA